MNNISDDSFTLLKTFIKTMNKNEGHGSSLDIACTGKSEFINDIIMEQARNLTIKIIKSMNEELIEMFYDFNLNIIEFIITSKEHKNGVEIKVPILAKFEFSKEIEHLISSVKQQILFKFGEENSALAELTTNLS